ncbi:MAG: tetratricopeptide repeat protein [Clostridia bacterium]
MNNSLDENFDDLSKFDCDILITTRNNFANCDNKKIVLNQIEDEYVSLQIFKKYYGRETTQQEDEIIKQIIEKVSALPLILELLAFAIANSGIKLDEILADVTKANFNFPEEKINYDKDGKPLNSSLDDILVYIFDLAKLEINTLYLIVLTNLSLIPYTGIQRSDLREVFSSMEDVNTTDLMDAFNELVNISIIQEDETTDTISLHPVISDMCTKRFKPDLKKCEKLSNWCINKAKNFLSVMHLEYCIFIAARINNYDGESAYFFGNIGDVYSKAKRYIEAEQMYKKTIEIQQRLSKESPEAFKPDLANSYNNIAILYRTTQRYSEAEQMHKKALETSKN